ncbi:MAG: DNA polymerase I [Streptococcaceae bacterium]|jgi:DNA polymerase-1|nr:DNA polymerase I [Streptococcaceae bacterium]
MTKNKLLLIDGSSIAFRAFFAFYNQIDNFKSPTGLHTNAIFGFQRMLMSLLTRIQPTHVLIAFDAGKTTFRTTMAAEKAIDYKGGRAKTPDEFREQMPFIKEMIDKMGIKHYDLVDYEADDIIGTLDKLAEAETNGEKDWAVTIVSGDKDLIQLTDDNTVVETSKKGVAEFESWTPAYLQAQMGLTPAQFIDLKALQGDSSDNYPGVTGVGPKTALNLLHDWGSLDGIYENIDALKKSKMKDNLIADREVAYLCRDLATINTAAPITITLDDTIYTGPQVDALVRFYEDMGFQQFKNQLLAESGSDIPVYPEAEPLDVDWEEATDASPVAPDDFYYLEILRDNYHTELIIGLVWGNADHQYVSSDLQLLPKLQALVNTYDYKKNFVLLAKHGITPALPTYDAMLAKYLVSTTEDNKISTLASLYETGFLPTNDDVYGKGTKLAQPANDVLFPHLARKLKVLSLTKEKLLQDLADNGATDLLTTMEIPLARVLSKMELTGIAASSETLQSIGAENDKRLQDLTAAIYQLAGTEFNLNSPKQLGDILFETLQIQGDKKVKKTKTGYSTSADILEQFADQDIVAKILEYRQIAKIQSTYVQGLIPQIAPDGKIHTRYVQDLTQTGRLSSVDPNLQNIPVRLEEGRLIRKAFLPSAGNVLLSSDYSQIELRVLAEVSGDPNLRAAFANDEDVHTATAMRVFGIDRPDAVTPNDRRKAKAVNFGISYGETEYGLAKRLAIPNKEAASIIRTYFERFPEIATYIDETKREAKDKGYVETLFHRRRKLPEINSRNFMIRQGAERQAINAPIQGTAGDILKLAMIHLDSELEKQGLKAKMLLQVHDEIILDVPLNELDTVKKLVQNTMESAVPDFTVPLKVEENTGKTWYEAK